jgi:intein-encoded DNA endonuclease-like protein
MPIYKKVNKDFFKTWSPQMAYVLGFFAADGYITVNKRGGQFWCIQITDKKLLESIKTAIDSGHKISIRNMRKNENTLYRLQIGSIEMCDDMRKLGFSQQKTKSLAVPQVPEKYFSDFTRGYFDGDGNVWMGEIHKERKTKHVLLLAVFTSCSHSFLEHLHKRLTVYGIIGGSLYRSKQNYSRLQYSTRNALKLYDFMYNHIDEPCASLWLQRKRKVFQKFVKLRL